MPGRALMALATLMYAPVPIEEVSEGKGRVGRRELSCSGWGGMLVFFAT